MNINELITLVIRKDASDLHLVVGKPPIVRLNGELTPLPQHPVLTAENAQMLVLSLMTPQQKELYLKQREFDFSYAVADQNGSEHRFRVNAYYQRNTAAASLRYIPNRIRSFEDLRLPSTMARFKDLQQGFVLVTGPTGHGKSTTLATIVHQINLERNAHIVTIEDPIEYTYPLGKSLISQREVNVDTYSWKAALRAVLREDPDVVLVGEMRDYETISAALTVAETGHLVLSTLHTNSAAQTIDRIIDAFPEHQQNQVRQQLASTLSAVVCQRLVPALNGGRIPAVEILLSNAAVRNSIRESKTHLIDNIIQTSKELGMVKLEEYFARLISAGSVSLEVAQRFVLQPAELRRYLKK
ncbi:MAG: PilT/PilU family type 4a pilus ATPase [Candidatus Roizmanbacteria bacterium]|nr:PilT/PilU family type 4a pilus ATPase [Candidatus Roizmanbacteria bacterium]